MSYRGMNQHTGMAIDGVAHLRQSILRLLFTPIGSRLMHRNYGSLIPMIIDMPSNPRTIALMRASIADALIKYEPRIQITGIDVIVSANSKIIKISGSHNIELAL